MPPLGFVAADVLDDGLSGFGALSQQSPLRRIDTVMPRALSFLRHLFAAYCGTRFE